MQQTLRAAAAFIPSLGTLEILSMTPSIDGNVPFDQHLQQAVRAAQTGYLGLAEKHCLCALDMVPGAPDALAILGIVAARFGAKGHALKLFGQALQARPGDQTILANRQRVQAMPDPPARSAGSTSYMLIKAWGYGFWSDVSHVLGCLLLAEITGRTPIVHWGANSRYGGSAEADAFSLFFEPLSSVRVKELMARADRTVFPPKWKSFNLMSDELQKWSGPGARTTALQFLERPEDVIVCDFSITVVDVAPWVPADHPAHGKSIDSIYRYLLKKYLKIRPELHARYRDFQATHLPKEPYVAVHLRGSDKAIEDPDLTAVNSECMRLLASQDQSQRILLLTDDQRLLGECTRTYGSRVVFTDSQRTADQTGTHYLQDVDRKSLGEEIIVDTFLAAGAETFIGNGHSNVAAIVALLKDWAPGRCHLVRPSLLLKRNLLLHRPDF